MPTRTSRAPLAVALVLLAAAPLAAQRSDADSATYLYNKHLFLDAQPLLQRLVDAGSADPEIHLDLAFALVAYSRTLPDAPGRKAARAAAHAEFVKAVSLGSKNEQARAYVASLPADGGDDPVFSQDPVVDSAMQLAEKAYAAKDIPTAIAQYQRALAHDSTLYLAAVFTGDAYMVMNQLDSAYQWYRNATRINPNRETAWRYWSDVLVKNGNLDEGRDKAVEAIVAEPYNRLSRSGLTAWAQHAHRSLRVPRVAIPVKDTSATHSAAWLAYDSMRRAQGVDTPGHRHTIAEEVAALQAAMQAGGDAPEVADLRLLDGAGALEAFIFFFRPDAGIAQDYDLYRASHTDILRRFWLDLVIQK